MSWREPREGESFEQYEIRVNEGLASYPFPLKSALDRLAYRAINTTAEELDSIIDFFDRLAKADGLPEEVAPMAKEVRLVVGAVQHRKNRQGLDRFFAENPPTQDGGDES